MSAAPEDRIPADLEQIPAWSRNPGDYERTGCHADLWVEAGQLVAAARGLYARGYFLEDIAGLDVAEGILLSYHFDRFEVSQRVRLRLIAPHGGKKAPSIAAVFSGADWHERECFDFFGVEFENHPNLKPLLLPDDLGVNPLLKDKDRRSLFGLLPLARVMGTTD